MSVEKELLGRFPTHALSFILASGFFTVFFVPIDIIKLLSGSRISFLPFANVNYVSSGNAQQAALILGIGVAFGFFILLIYGLFEWVNHLYKYLPNHEWTGQWKCDHYSDPQNIIEKENIELTSYNKWIKKSGLALSMDYLNSIYEMSTGLLFASELVFAVSVVLTIISRTFNWITLTELLIIVWIMFGAYKFTQRKYQSNVNYFIGRYKEYLKSIRKN